MEVSKARWLKLLEKENSKLKRLLTQENVAQARLRELAARAWLSAFVILLNWEGVAMNHKKLSRGRIIVPQAWRSETDYRYTLANDAVRRRDCAGSYTSARSGIALIRSTGLQMSGQAALLGDHEVI